MGEVCVSGLEPGEYTVNETSPPPGYGDASETDQVVTVVNGTNCTDNLPAQGNCDVQNPPLADIQVNFRDAGSGETNVVGSTINCVEGATDLGDNDATPTTDWDKSETHLGLDPVRTSAPSWSIPRQGLRQLRKRGPAQPAPVASSRNRCLLVS